MNHWLSWLSPSFSLPADTSLHKTWADTIGPVLSSWLPVIAFIFSSCDGACSQGLRFGLRSVRLLALISFAYPQLELPAFGTSRSPTNWGPLPEPWENLMAAKIRNYRNQGPQAMPGRAR